MDLKTRPGMQGVAGLLPAVERYARVPNPGKWYSVTGKQKVKILNLESRISNDAQPMTMNDARRANDAKPMTIE